MKDRVKPAVGVDSARLAKLLRALESKRFAERQRANEELERLDELAEPALNMFLQSKPALDSKRRVEDLLERLVRSPPPDVLQACRAVEVLEAVGTPDAPLSYKRLRAAGQRRVTKAARQSLARLNAAAAKP